MDHCKNLAWALQYREMNAWFESGRSNTFANVHPADVVFRTSSQVNSLVFGNGLMPDVNAAVYITSNCIGINRVPDASAAPHIVMDIGGGVACRAGLTFCDTNTVMTSRAKMNGSNGMRAAATGVILNNGLADTVSLDRTGLIQTVGTMRASNAFFGSHVAPSVFAAKSEVLTVIGKGSFDQGICLVVEADVTTSQNASITFNSLSSVMTLGSHATMGPYGLHVNGAVVSTGLMFAPGFKVLSDVRLKQDIVASELESDLAEVLAVSVKRYTLADNGADRGVGKQIGVLAHELSSVMPDAVSQVDDYLPDVMSAATIDSQLDATVLGTWLRLVPTLIPHTFHKGDNLRLRLCGDTAKTILTADVVEIDPTDERHICVVGCSHGKTLILDGAVGSELFVYGTLSHDIKAVDTTHILFRLVSALQCINTKLEKMEHVLEQLGLDVPRTLGGDLDVDIPIVSSLLSGL